MNQKLSMNVQQSTKEVSMQQQSTTLTKGVTMKTVLTFATALMFLSPVIGFAADSTISGRVDNTAVITGTQNKAGSKGEANLGSVKIDDSNISGRVSNNARITGGRNEAKGGGFLSGGGEANMGSVKIEDSRVSGHISNRATIRNSTNIAGSKGEANMGTVTVDDANVSGHIHNNATITGVRNEAQGGGFLSGGGEANVGSVKVD